MIETSVTVWCDGGPFSDCKARVIGATRAEALDRARSRGWEIARGSRHLCARHRGQSDG